MDEISISAPTTICSIDHGHFESFVIRPEDFGLPSGKKADLVGGSAEDNAHIIRELFNGRNDGVYQSRRTAVILNAGAGLYMSGKASSLLEGTDMASGLIRSGEAMKKLDEFVRVSRSMAS
jgi:anthranilate phosphoribosyltransferase